MSFAMPALQTLSVDERLDLLEAVWASLEAEAAAQPLDDAERAEVRKRLAAHAAAPGAAIPWPQVEAEPLPVPRALR